MLQSAGMSPEETTTEFGLAHPEILTQIHKKYIEAGADIVYASTFGTNRFKKKEIGLQVMLLINAGTNEKMVFKEPVQLQIDGKDFYLGAHSNAPEPCMLGDTSKGPNLVVGCESGKYFFFEHDRITTVGIDD